MTLTLPAGDWSSKLYPGESTEAVNTRITEALSWVFYHAPCLQAVTFDDNSSQANLARSIVKRALKYEKDTADGAVVSETGGPFSRTFDTRRAPSSNLFSDRQIEVLKSLCGVAVQFGAVTVELSVDV